MSADELVDVVDAADVVVGRVTRQQMRTANLRHRCVWIVVQDSAGRLFVHRRTPTKDVYPSYWDLTVGGVVGAGEGYAPAAARELREELSIEASFVGGEVPVGFEDAATAVIGRVYLSRFDGNPTLQASEVEYGEWATPERLVYLLRHERFCPDGLAALCALLEGSDELRQALRALTSLAAELRRSG